MNMIYIALQSQTFIPERSKNTEQMWHSHIALYNFGIVVASCTTYGVDAF